MQHKLLLFLALLAALCFTAGPQSTQSPDQPDRHYENNWPRIVKAEPSILKDDIDATRLQSIRGQAFDREIGSPYRLDQPAPSGTTQGIAHDRYIPSNPLPVKASDLIAQVTFVDYQPYLSPLNEAFTQWFTLGSNGLISRLKTFLPVQSLIYFFQAA